MADHLDQSLRTVVDFLEAKGYRYAVIGGIVLAYWGVVDWFVQFTEALQKPELLADYNKILLKVRGS